MKTILDVALLSALVFFLVYSWEPILYGVMWIFITVDNFILALP